MKKKYADGGMARPAVMPGRSGTAGRPDATGLARAAAMSGRTMPTTGRPAMKKGGKVAEKGESKAMVKKEIEFFKKKGAPKSMIKHEKAEAKKYARGGGIESKGKTRGKFV